MPETKIKILPESIANKIAAGEVVQRPESVVKELIENSIDAEAKNIDVIIKRAGKALIQVFDDGLGMSEEDALLSILKHATSKIFSYEDLENIHTLGFRGEALSSIAAVSQLEIRTERREDELGTLLRFDDAENIVKEKGSYPKGTSVSVKNLFYNTPARRNFLRTDATELKHIIDTFNKIALSHPDIHFRFFNEDELIFDYPAGTIEEKIKKIFADNMLDALVPVNEKTDYLSLTGFIGKPSMLKKSKGDQYLFLNYRYVISRQVNHAVFTAFDNILEKGDYPFFILFLELDPQKVDVNVHPSKLEVKFDDEKDIYNFVVAVIRKTLGTHDLVPAMMFTDVPDKTDLHNEKLRFDHFNKIDRNDFSDRPDFSNRERSGGKIITDNEIDLIFNSIPDNVITRSKDDSSELPFQKSGNREVLHEIKTGGQEAADENDSPFIIQLHNKYILSQIRSGLMIIDQHVAHERILYEKVLKIFEANMPFSQQLLFPKKMELDPGTFGIVKELNQYLSKLGFAIKFSAKNVITIEGVPEDVHAGSEEKILIEIIDEYLYNQKEKKLEERDNIAKSYSCKAAIKAGDKLSEREMRILIDQLFATSMPYVCPHGRPVLVKISLDEFDRRFGRTS